MNIVPVSRIKVHSKLSIIRESLSELESLAKIPKDDFLSDKKNFAVAEHYLRRTLEAVFDIAGHIVSRYPLSSGKRPHTYKDLARTLAEKRIVEKDFGEDVLIRMAGYRNRMVHFYDEITEEEMYEILQGKLTDIETYARAVTSVLNNPGKFGLVVSDN
jgi:uncharacterized protein YutE (UPF0331/DUF86 family)